jgi:dihydrofolate reductase
VPLVVVSKQPHPNLPKAHVWNLDPRDALQKARQEFGENILIEGGASFISYLLDHKVVDVLELSVTQASGGADLLDYKKYLSLAENVSKSVVADTTFYTAEFKTLK